MRSVAPLESKSRYCALAVAAPSASGFTSLIESGLNTNRPAFGSSGRHRPRALRCASGGSSRGFGIRVVVQLHRIFRILRKTTLAIVAVLVVLVGLVPVIRSARGHGVYPVRGRLHREFGFDCRAIGSHGGINTPPSAAPMSEGAPAARRKGPKENGEVLSNPAIPARRSVRADQFIRTATESELQPSVTAARVTISLRAFLHGPWAAETRPNQRVNVPLDHLLQLLRASCRRLPPA